MIAIADAQGARTSTIMLQKYYREEQRHNFGVYGTLPPRGDAWYSFRIDPKMFNDMAGKLMQGPWEVIFLVYFLHQEDLTDERGVFDIAKANDFDDPDVKEWTKEPITIGDA